MCWRQPLPNEYILPGPLDQLDIVSSAIRSTEKELAACREKQGREPFSATINLQKAELELHLHLEAMS